VRVCACCAVSTLALHYAGLPLFMHFILKPFSKKTSVKSVKENANKHGFIAGRSCTTNLLSTLNDWTRLLDKREPMDALYLDFAKA
jgi:hypothetical protein